jgi:hypothetical protein
MRSTWVTRFNQIGFSNDKADMARSKARYAPWAFASSRFIQLSAFDLATELTMHRSPNGSAGGNDGKKQFGQRPDDEWREERFRL